MKWVITKTTKTIGEYECVKALTIYRDRAYIAWFTSAIPIQDGPWKFGGLPGLIVEVYDEERFFYFKFISLRKTTLHDFTIPVSTKNFNQFIKDANVKFKKMEALMNGTDKIDPTCISCSQNAKMKITTLENIAY